MYDPTKMQPRYRQSLKCDHIHIPFSFLEGSKPPARGLVLVAPVIINHQWFL